MSLINLTAKLKAFRQSERGLAAVEFALAAPLIILLCLGGFELSRYTLLNQKIEKIAFTVADVTSQNETLTNSQIQDIFEAAGQIADPFDFNTNGLAIVTSVYQAVGDEYPEVNWQRCGGGSGTFTSDIGSEGLTATMPNGLELNERDNVIISEVYYAYEPMFTLGLFEAKNIYKTTIFKPRLGDLTTSPTGMGGGAC